MGGSCLSLVSLYGKFLRRCFTAAGLTSRMAEIDGGETVIQFWGPSAAGGSEKPKLVLIHGFGPHSDWQWRPQVSFFAREFDLYVPDLVFFGGSHTKSPDCSEIFQATCVAKLLDKLGITRYSVIGTSYGGFVAYHMAAIWPERVDKVVIASSAVNLRPSDNAGLLKRARMETLEELMLPTTAARMRAGIQLSIFRQPYYIPDFFLNDCINKLYCENRKEKAELLKGLTLGRDENVNLAHLSQKVLVVWGEHDKIFLLEKAIELKEMLGERVRLEVIRNASHAPHMERAGQFNDIVYNFLYE